MITLRAKIVQRNFLVGRGNLLPEIFRERIIVPVVISVITLLILFMAATEFAVSLYNHDDLLQLSDSLIVFLGYLSWFLCYWHSLVNFKQFHLLFTDVEDIIHQRMNTERGMYADARKRIDFYLDLFRTTQIAPVISIYFIPYVSIIYQWLTGGYTIEKWFFMNKIWVPFELNTSVRCASLVLFEILDVSCAMLILYWMISMVVEFMLYTKAFVQDIKSMFGQMDRMAKGAKNYKLVMDHCRQIIVLQCRIYRCMSQLAKLMDFLTFTIVIPSVVDIVIFLFILEMYLDSATLSKLFIPIMGAVLYLVLLFVFFYSGEMLHSNQMELSDLICESEWYRYPSTAQRMILMMIGRAQRPFYLSIYGVATLRLNNYVEIVKKIYSGFMLMHTTH